MDDQRAVSDGRQLRWGLALTAIAALLGLGLLALWGRERPPNVRAASEPAAPALHAQPVQAVQPLRAAAEPAAVPVVAQRRMSDALEHPHPITAEHLRNFRQVDLLDDAWKALKSHQFARARELVATHRAEYPGQWEDMNEGLELLADCMEQPGARSVSRARTFYAQRTASTMRRRVRRYCLEPYGSNF